MEEQDTNAELEEAKEKLEALEKQIEGLRSVGSSRQISQKAESEIHFGGDVSILFTGLMKMIFLWV